MDKITVDIKCTNCVKAKLDIDDWYRCSLNGKKWVMIMSTPICKYWKPWVESVSVWIARAEQTLKES